MTTSHPSPLELAKQGNVQAITFLINRVLQPKGITTKVVLKNSLLQVLLESEQVPDQESLPLLIYKGVDALGIASVKRLRIYGKESGNKQPSWSKDFDFSARIETVMSQPMDQSKGFREDVSQVKTESQSSSTLENKAQNKGSEVTSQSAQGILMFLVITVLFGSCVYNSIVDTAPTSTSIDSAEIEACLRRQVEGDTVERHELEAMDRNCF